MSDKQKSARVPAHQYRPSQLPSSMLRALAAVDKLYLLSSMVVGSSTCLPSWQLAWATSPVAAAEASSWKHLSLPKAASPVVVSRHRRKAAATLAPARLCPVFEKRPFTREALITHIANHRPADAGLSKHGRLRASQSREISVTRDIGGHGKSPWRHSSYAVRVGTASPPSTHQAAYIYKRCVMASRPSPSVLW